MYGGDKGHRAPHDKTCVIHGVVSHSAFLAAADPILYTTHLSTVLSIWAAGLTRPIERLYGRKSPQLTWCTPCQVIEASRTRAVYILSQPLKMWQRLNCVITLLEGMEQRALEYERRLEALAPPASDVPSTDSTASPMTPLNGPVTASQLYHAVLANNKALEDLLASLKGERKFGRSHGKDTHEESEVEIRLPPSSRKYSVRASPSWLSRLGHHKVTLTDEARNWPERDDSCYSMKDRVSVGGLSERRMQQNPSPDHPGCTACDRHGSDTEQSVVGKRKAKPRFNTSMEPYHTVPKFKDANISRRTRPSATRS